MNLDLRIILHRAGENVVLCYVDNHDDAYRWAERRRLETHPTTGAAQLVELREVIQEIAVPVYVEEETQAPPKAQLFSHVPDDQLLGYGVPVEWLEDVKAATEDSMLDLADHLPAEAAEALLELAVGKTPQPSLPAPSGADPFAHPDALRRFRVMRNVEELAEALEYPWEKWTIFLHPAQLGLVERTYNGPARVSGSAGTGKTVVALHRAAFLAKSTPGSRVLLTTFSDALANLLRTKLQMLIDQEVQPDGRIVVDSLDAVGRPPLRSHVWSAAIGQTGDHWCPCRRRRQEGRNQFLPDLSPDRVGSSSGRLAVGHMGKLPGCGPHRPLPQAVRNATKGIVAGVPKGQVGLARTGTGDQGRNVWAVDPRS